MANPRIRSIKSINIGIVKNTSNDGTHDKGYVFGNGDILVNSATNGPILTVVGSTADVTEPWTLTLIMPEKMRYRRTTSVETSTGAITGAHYSEAIDTDGNVVISFIADAEDTGGPISNDEDVTIQWQAYDSTTRNATMFSVKCQSDNSGHTATIKARFTEGGTLHTMILFSGDTISGPFSELEVDALSNAATSCFVYFQEH